MTGIIAAKFNQKKSGFPNVLLDKEQEIIN